MKRNIKYIIILLLLASASFVQKVCAQDEEKPKAEVKVTDAKIKLAFDTADGGKIIKAIVTGKDATGKEVGVKDVTVKILIKKSFGSLSVEGDNMVTDETGTMTVKFPKALPGDKDGNVSVQGVVEDDPVVGALETESISSFGIPTHVENMLNHRALWAAGSNAPIPLVIAVTLIIVLVWGTILFIILKLIIINKSGKNENVVKSEV